MQRIPRIKNKINLLFVILMFNVSCNGQQQTMTISLARHRTKSINPDYFFGFNAQLLHGPSMNDTAFIEAIKGLHPSILRYPGGTIANQWEWKTGWTNASEFKNLPIIPYRLEDFKRAIKATAAMPIFVLNMCTSTLEDQVAMLKHAQEIGLPVKLIELGNEFYNPIPLNIQTFPTGTKYAAKANEWISKLRKEFPDLKIAVVGRSEKEGRMKNKLLGKNTDDRMQNWNNELFSTIKNADAVTFHIYSGDGLNMIHTDERRIKHQKKSEYTDDDRAIFQSAFNSPGAEQEIFGVPFNRVRQFLDNDARQVPSGMEIWITECNLFQKTGIVSGTWTHGLYATTLCMLLGETPKTDLVVLHTLAKDAQFAAIFNDSKGFADNYKKPSTVKNSYSASGYALSLLMDATKNMKNISPLSFDKQFGISASAISYNALLGYKFSDEEHANYFFINLSSKSLSLNLTKLNLKNATFVQMSSDPGKQITTENDVEIFKGKIVNAAAELKAYSIFEIRSEN
jgi:hypothetical protein